ncbi:MAG: hypothetical protein HY652_11705 [Acidobacteria bacterium]|nr:hypothetical protein [Acidobacteriota bacterium]
MIQREEIEKVRQFQSGEHPVTSLYLNIDAESHPYRKWEVQLKNLIKEKKEGLEGLDFSRKGLHSVREDFERIQKYVQLELEINGTMGLAVFSCSAENFWRTFQLTVSVKDRLTVDRSPYVIPLLAVFNGARKICVVLADRNRGRIFEIVLGHIREHHDVFSNVPDKVRAGGWHGYEEKTIQRHIQDHVLHHLKSIADLALSFFKQENFDRLILGGIKEVVSNLRPLLHSYLEDKYIGEMDIPFESDPKTILKKSLEVERLYMAREHARLVSNLVTVSKSHGNGVLGWENTLRALQRNQVQQLFIQSDARSQGIYCDRCRYLDVAGERCPLCNRDLALRDDIVDPLIGEALARNCQIEQVAPPSELERYGGIGAVLRFRG